MRAGAGLPPTFSTSARSASVTGAVPELAYVTVLRIAPSRRRGPRLEKAAIWSCPSTAPTVSAPSAAPGLLT
jgi:hypothetical protein